MVTRLQFNDEQLRRLMFLTLLLGLAFLALGARSSVSSTGGAGGKNGGAVKRAPSEFAINPQW